MRLTASRTKAAPAIRCCSWSRGFIVEPNCSAASRRVEAKSRRSRSRAHVGLGRSDLIINILNNEWVIESKIFHNITQFTDGKAQLAYYIKSLGLNKGVYLVFLNAEVTNTYVLEGEDLIEGVELTTYIVRYDLEIDFSEPRKEKRAVAKKKKDAKT